MQVIGRINGLLCPVFRHSHICCFDLIVPLFSAVGSRKKKATQQAEEPLDEYGDRMYVRQHRYSDTFVLQCYVTRVTKGALPSSREQQARKVVRAFIS